MTDEEYRIEKIKDYRRDILRHHSVEELRSRFVNREHPKSFDDTFMVMGAMIDSTLDYQQALWVGYEYLTDSKMLDLKYAHLFD